MDRLSDHRKGIAALQRDARRYRWLRAQPNDTKAPRIDVVSWTSDLDQYAATRRAVVRAAAEIGKTMGDCHA